MKNRSFHIYQVRDETEVQAIKDKVGALDGVQQVMGDHKTKIFTVQWNKPATWEAIVNTVNGMGYRAATR